MVYHLQTIYSNQQGIERLARLAKTTNGLFRDRLTLDMSSVSWIDANLASILGAILVKLSEKRSNRIRISNLRHGVETILRKNQFLTNFGFEDYRDNNRTTMPFKRLGLSDKHQFETYIAHQFQGKGLPEMSVAATKIFRKKVFEIFQNAAVHSESSVGVFVCGQHFPTRKRLAFTITDMGIGIRDSVRNYFSNPRIGSIAALKWALKAHHTTRTGKTPGGLGLTELQKFARLNRGMIQIASRFAFYEFIQGDGCFAKMTTSFPGTAVTIVVNTADEANYVLASELNG